MASHVSAAEPAASGNNSIVLNGLSSFHSSSSLEGAGRQAPLLKSHGKSQEALCNDPATLLGASTTPGTELQQERANWLRRSFGALTSGGVRQSMLTLVSTALGGGVLTISYVLSLTGVCLGLLLILLAAFLAHIGTTTLMEISLHTGLKTYAAIFSHVAGPRAGPILDSMIFLYGNGALIGYMVFLSDFIPSLISLIPNHPVWLGQGYIAVIISACFVSPFVVQKELDALRHFTPLSILALIYSAILVACMSPSNYKQHHGQEGFGDIVLFQFDLDIFQAFALCLFAFNCHINVIPVGAALQRPTKARIGKVSSRTNLLQAVFYLLIGITGYFSFLAKTPQDILHAYPKSHVGVIIARGLLTCALLVSIIMNAHPSYRSGLQILDYLRGAGLESTRRSWAPMSPACASPSSPPEPNQTPPPPRTSLPQVEQQVPQSPPRVRAPSGTPPPPTSHTTSSQHLEGRGRLIMPPSIPRSFDELHQEPCGPRVSLALGCTLLQALIAISAGNQSALILSVLGASIATCMMLVIPAYALGVLMENGVMPRTFRNFLKRYVMYFFAIISVSSLPIHFLQIFKVLSSKEH